ncbi:hypothetical protein FOZ62_017979 [Perkinsus olseni]|uniref:Uncharacterized protein n=1 Tax=Perkinsus olseni TaxID=32597 RepID=A0A7J6TGN0_PEROL|nr:hypothetical protein FOZ62_017979 [Perkinsus olseni]
MSHSMAATIPTGVYNTSQGSSTQQQQPEEEEHHHHHTTICQQLTNFFLSLCFLRGSYPETNPEATEALIPVNDTTATLPDYGAKDCDATTTAASLPQTNPPEADIDSAVGGNLPRPRGDHHPPPSTCGSSTVTTSPEAYQPLGPGHRRNRQTMEFSGIPTPTISDAGSDDEYIDRDPESDKVSSGSSGTSEKLERMREEGRKRVEARKRQEMMNHTTTCQ